MLEASSSVAGYSQSMSMPSKPQSFRRVTADLAKVDRLAALAAVVAKFVDQVQPPMDSRTLRLRCAFFRRKSCLTHPNALSLSPSSQARERGIGPLLANELIQV